MTCTKYGNDCHSLYEYKQHNFFTLHISHLLDQVSVFQIAGHILLMDHEISLGVTTNIFKCYRISLKISECITHREGGQYFVKVCSELWSEVPQGSKHLNDVNNGILPTCKSFHHYKLLKLLK